jgi:16S rRNA (guanine527-N7)-methyltransferase
VALPLSPLGGPTSRAGAPDVSRLTLAQRRIAALAGAHALPDGSAERLGRLLGLLAEKNAPTAVHDPLLAADVHVADALVALELPELGPASRIADLGAGAGLPGLVLAVALPAADLVLVESAARKCEFMAHAIEVLELDNARVVSARAEAWEEGIGTCDVVCARALAALPVLCEYAAPLLREGGALIAWKGQVDASEQADGHAAAELLGLAPTAVLPVEPYRGSERHTLHVYRKVAATPPGYPRRPGIATKRPLAAEIRRPRR